MEESRSFNDTSENTAYEDLYEDPAKKTTLTVNIYIELYTILSLICIAFNVIIAFVIIKYRRLRTDKSNIILLNWTIVNSLFMISSPIIFSLALDWYSEFLGFSVLCVLEELQGSFSLANVFLIELLLMNWYLELYYPASYGKSVKYLRFELAVIYAIVTVSVGYHVHACYGRMDASSKMFQLFCYMIFMVFMIIMNMIHLVKRRRLPNPSKISNTPLYLVNTYFLSVCPLLSAIFFQFLFHENSISIIILVGGLILAVMNPIYFFIILYRFDKDYRKFLQLVLSCHCFKYKDDELQEEPVVSDGLIELNNISVDVSRK